eukprot:CAMPEP_0115070246 /NCGR_PEP_ID=MMETSP0227-20121206/13002_1 /TAXON_ID=89957 /ORGANISM="Polarella glacialis, Strain CCMP 1383" /LENGTH=140 /DNA_ID=CAMNT_0002456729 /DNA_START=256 /DNA_END=675 /DNA_ORIENTATION=-
MSKANYAIASSGSSLQSGLADRVWLETFPAHRLGICPLSVLQTAPELDPKSVTSSAVEKPVQPVSQVIWALYHTQSISRSPGTTGMKNLGPVPVTKYLKFAATSPERSGGMKDPWAVWIRKHLLETPVIPGTGNVVVTLT